MHARQFLKQEESGVSVLAKIRLEKHMTILSNHEVREAEKTSMSKKRLFAVNKRMDLR